MQYRLLDSMESTDYAVPPLRILKLSVDIAKRGKLSNFDDPIGKITVMQADQQATIDGGSEGEMLLQSAAKVKEFDPDMILTSGGDSYLFPYLIHRATENHVLDKFTLSRDPVSFASKAVGRRKNVLLVWTHVLPRIYGATVWTRTHRRGQHICVE